MVSAYIVLSEYWNIQMTNRSKQLTVNGNGVDRETKSVMARSWDGDDRCSLSP